LHSGQKIQVVETNSKKHSGTFAGFSDTAISFHDAAGEQNILKQNIRSVKVGGNKRRLRNTLIGGAVGAGVGAGIGAATWEDHGFVGGKGTGAAVCAAFGFVVGLVVGVVLPSHSTIYSANQP